jgi:hypothetical protein
MNDEPIASRFSMREVFRAFFCTRSLWNSFALYWLFLPLMMMFLTVSLILTPRFYFVLFPVLSFLPCVLFMWHKKRKPDFFHSLKTEIFESGTSAQKLGAFLFVSIFFGAFGFGTGTLVLMSIYAHYINPGFIGPVTQAIPLFIGVGLQFGIFMGAFTWVAGVINKEIKRPDKN